MVKLPVHPLSLSHHKWKTVLVINLSCSVSLFHELLIMGKLALSAVCTFQWLSLRAAHHPVWLALFFSLSHRTPYPKTFEYCVKGTRVVCLSGQLLCWVQPCASTVHQAKHLPEHWVKATFHYFPSVLPCECKKMKFTHKAYKNITTAGSHHCFLSVRVMFPEKLEHYPCILLLQP